MKAAVIGYPIKHSLSPKIHTHWLKEHQVEGEYTAIEVSPNNLEKALGTMQAQGFKGCNVTIPHKVACVEFLDEISALAKDVGAVNTIIFQEDGKKIGTNTDVAGFINNIKQHQPDWKFKEKNICVLGAGGAARGVCVGLIREGVDKIFLTNRTKEKAEELQSLSPEKISIVDWENKGDYFANTDMLINTTSLGMVGHPALPCNITLLSKTALVTDIVYNPLKTVLLDEAEKHGLTTVTGLGMLLHQAAPAFEAWTGILPTVTNMLEQNIIKAMHNT